MTNFFKIDNRERLLLARALAKAEIVKTEGTKVKLRNVTFRKEDAREIFGSEKTTENAINHLKSLMLIDFASEDIVGVFTLTSLACQAEGVLEMSEFLRKEINERRKRAEEEGRIEIEEMKEKLSSKSEEGLAQTVKKLYNTNELSNSSDDNDRKVYI